VTEGNLDNAGVMEIDALIHRWRDLRVLVIGDVMLDEYRVGEVARVSPEALWAALEMSPAIYSRSAHDVILLG
jgi:Ran GTPase-activating protein (RanGAP) involved in mRNA processing and transport